MTEPPASARAEATLDQRILAEQLQLIIAQSPQGVAAPALLAVISALLLWESAGHTQLLAALGLIFVALASWVSFYLRFRRNGIEPRDAESWGRQTILRTLAHGLSWGIYSLVIFPPNAVYQSLLVAFMYGLVAGALVVDGPHFRTFVAFALPTLLPVVLRCFVEGTAETVASGAAGLVGLAQCTFSALNSSRVNRHAILTRFENSTLLGELAEQKERAERANREKSRFLAAASHDLRQPMHALRLFASAAKDAGTDAERQLIVQSIDTSVASLTALFDSLLEVSRLDAGALGAQPQSVELWPLLRDLTTEFASSAQEKQLSLRLRGVSARVRTDPVLLGRLLRNLLSNALTYTERGGVLLACRRRGDLVRVEVWDTGVGIPERLQAQVFDEFFQVGNPERDRRRGVGLGLSIVTRIAALLGHRLDLASRVGRGSRFALELPLCTEALADAQQAPILDESLLLGAVVMAGCDSRRRCT